MKKLIACTLLIVAGPWALAQDSERGSGLYLEPGVTYQSGDSSIDYPTPFTNSTATVKGFGAVVRGGVHVYENFFVAADARYGMLEFRDNANNYTADATSWDIAPTVGMQMADYGLRLYGGYVLAGELDPKGANGYDFRFEDPNGWRVGAGIKVKHVSVNIEWQELAYDKTKIESLGGFTPGVSTDAIKYEGKGIVASVTFPIEFN